MWRVNPDARVFLALGNTDMRKSINGLSVLVGQELEEGLCSGDLFAFCNRRRKLVKILYWSHNGFCLWPNYLASHYPSSDGKNVFWQS